MRESKKLRLLCLAALFAGAIAVTTAYLLHIPIPTGGYIHLGDALIYLAACLLPAPLSLIHISIIMGDARISSFPAIVSNHVDAQLIHEAAIGRIAGDQILKLKMCIRDRHLFYASICYPLRSAGKAASKRDFYENRLAEPERRKRPRRQGRMAQPRPLTPGIFYLILRMPLGRFYLGVINWYLSLIHIWSQAAMIAIV